MCLCLLCDCTRGQRRHKKWHLSMQTCYLFTHMHMRSRTNKHMPPHTHQHKQAIIIPLLQRCSISRDQSPGDLALPNTLRKSAENHLSSPSIFPLLSSPLLPPSAFYLSLSPAVCIASLLRFQLSFPVLCSLCLYLGLFLSTLASLTSSVSSLPSEKISRFPFFSPLL